MAPSHLKHALEEERLGLGLVADQQRQEPSAAEAKVSAGVVRKMFLTYMVSLSTIGDLKTRRPALIREMASWAAPVSGGLRYFVAAPPLFACTSILFLLYSPSNSYTCPFHSAGFYPIKCSLGLSFYEQTTGTVLLPLLVLSLLAVVEKVLSFGSHWMDAKALKSILVAAAVRVVFIFYPSVTKGLLQGWYLFVVQLLNSALELNP